MSEHVNGVLAGVRRVCAQTPSGPAYCHVRETASSPHTASGALAQQHVKQVALALCWLYFTQCGCAECQTGSICDCVSHLIKHSKRAHHYFSTSGQTMNHHAHGLLFQSVFIYNIIISWFLSGDGLMEMGGLLFFV